MSGLFSWLYQHSLGVEEVNILVIELSLHCARHSKFNRDLQVNTSMAAEITFKRNLEPKALEIMTVFQIIWELPLECNC